MKVLYKHWGAWPRQFPGLAQVQTIGYLPDKTEWIDRTFPTTNFSFILSGGGSYHHAGRSWQILAPTVILQWPGPRLQYGPCGKYAVWEEQYFIFRAEARAELEAARLFDTRQPVWRIQSVDRVKRLLAEIEETTAAAKNSAPGLADRLDRLVEQLILESLLGRGSPPPSPTERKLAEIRDFLKSHFQEPVDWASLAASRGFSLSSFRRHWKATTGEPPGRYLDLLRIREAQRLLVETHMPIADIAEACGYTDPLYFSRRFSERLGISASQYRKSFRRAVH